MEINLFDLSMASEEGAEWDGLAGQALCVLFSISQQAGDRASP